MSYYEPAAAPRGGAWPNAGQPGGWDARGNNNGQTVPFQRQFPPEGTDVSSRPSSARLKTEEPTAFGSQLDEVDRAVDNLVKSGKMFAGRRESMPILPAALPQPRISQMHRNYSAAGPGYEDLMRSQSAANLQNYYATARFAPRQAEQDQMMQAKRRLAAQRERELRNFHQEQQYNRSTLGDISNLGFCIPEPLSDRVTDPAILAEMSNFNTKDRVISPGSMTDEERRELIARQHRALYGERREEEPLGAFDLHSRGSNPPSTAGSVSGGTRGPSPLGAFDPFGYQNGSQEGLIQTPSNEHPVGATNGVSPTRSRTNSVSSPSSKGPYGVHQDFTKTTQSSRTSPSGSPPRLGRVSTTPVTNSGVAPIGTRPISSSQIPPPNGGLQKRSTTPIPSPLGYSNYPGEESYHSPGNSNVAPGSNKPSGNERSASAASNHTTSSQDPSIAWGSKVWGGSKGLGTVASVWG
ncbi:hypothetical protein AOL_s00078g369 [Orbilia oligospora ATCC 24927]|uniref:Uncharacterized protein n=2 Tax=Orbilia oligospora TaxID=2813651 RepID=G1XBS2_ARTOA|nr:hypothetical protein AOL_s00078g369 [Orbilia oligospora ATCC 24927]EGX49336.1 hypothetical protein AOL_s00078g369 [Orbilia oligospora ATCC 24927]KAF3288557.1 hypothetical protein TWF970_005621 [Orbilia oligospora]